MKILSRAERKLVEDVVASARERAETAARKALHSLGVDEADPPEHLSADDRTLRRRLKAHAHQLGDREAQTGKGRWEIEHLVEKVAYDRWHRMLFARFLSENNLLFSPKHGVPVSLHDCEELAPGMALRNGWEVAASFAAQMLPEIFRADDPACLLMLPPEDEGAMRQLVIQIPHEVFLADDSLGWVYQFWQTKRKDDVNHSGGKIGADELPAVTQLFTEDYMVLFLLHNTLGAWWTARHCSARFTFDYLRTGEDGSPAVGGFESWPATAREIKLLDPCMGSGHFLVLALPLLAEFRQMEEGLSEKDAFDAVLRDNIFGLEIDSRCTQLAAFNLALAAWKKGGYRRLPQMHLACCGLGIHASRDDWMKLANGERHLAEGMGRLYDLFQQAPTLGSLIDPRKVGKDDLFAAVWHDLQPLLGSALAKEKARNDDELSEMGVTAQGLARAAEILAGRFHLVATNVPYLGRVKQSETLKDFCGKTYPEAKVDLATCFVERCLSFCEKGGTAALETPQNWLFLGRYRKLRVRLLEEVQWDFVTRLGPHAFETISGEVVNVSLLTLSRQKPSADHQFAGLDVSEEKTPAEKAEGLRKKAVVMVGQGEQKKNPDGCITLAPMTISRLLGSCADSYHGISTTDYMKFGRFFWEFDQKGNEWIFQQSTVEETAHYNGKEHVLLWQEGKGELRDLRMLKVPVVITGLEAWGKKGIAVSQMRSLPVTIYCGESFDDNTSVIVPRNKELLPAIWSFCSSNRYAEALRSIDQSLKVTYPTLVKVPFDLEYWQKVAAEKYPYGLPKPHSDDPTQWLFNGHPNGSDAPLHVAVARMLGYRWPRQTGSGFPDCSALGPDGLEKHADADGIVCINTILGETPAVDRLRALLADAYGAEWGEEKQRELLARIGFEGKLLGDWLRDGFFGQHCNLFQQRPFIWHIWDGNRSGFSALVNYHSLTRATLGKLVYTYLGDWINRQRRAVDSGEEGSDARLEAALGLKSKLEAILEGEPPFDIFVRWKPLSKQAMGWSPDLNDGVRLNIRPFIRAGILRKNPKVNWGKDKGKEPLRDKAEYPWFWAWDGETQDWPGGRLFTGERFNDCHYSKAAKHKALHTHN